MDDIITRRAAYETLTEYYHHKHMSQHIALKEALDKVPSAYVPDTNDGDMNDDTISRRALMKVFSEFVKRSNNSDFAPTPTWNDAVSLVGSMPSAEPQRKEGMWIVLPTDPWIYACDQCGRLSDDDENYCPDCGAEMKGVK